MHEPRDREPQLSAPEPQQDATDVNGTLGTLLGGWRMLLPIGLAVVAVAMALMPSPIPPAIEVSRPAAAPGPAGTLTPVPQGGPGSARSIPRGVASRLEPAATPTPAGPTPVPTMPPIGDSGPAPLRKAGTSDPNVSTQHVIVVDGGSGAILYAENAYEPIAPASLTKIMTAILGIEHGKLSDRVKVDVDARTLSDSTVMGLEPWFDVTLQDLLYGLMLPSGNDAALAIGHHVAGSDEAFVRMMNEKAAWLGLETTQFANPHGLDAPGHYSSPYDMVVMARYAMQYPVFRKLAAAKAYDIRASNISYSIENLNPILWAYPGADGVKVGYTDSAGRSIVATATRNGHRVYVAFMRSTAGLVPDTVELFDWAFDSFVWPGDSAQGSSR